MPFYVLAHIQLRYGNENLDRWTEAFTILRGLMEDEGVKLRHGMLTQLGGRFYEIWHLWQVEDAEHMNRARRSLREKPVYHEIHQVFADVIETESLRLTQGMPYEPSQG